LFSDAGSSAVSVRTKPSVIACRHHVDHGISLEPGYQARREHRLDDAKAAYAAAVEQSRQADKPALLAQSLKGLGGIERDLGNTTAALDRYLEAATIQRNLDNPLSLAHAIRHVADILRENSQTSAALPHYEEALGIYRNHPETNTLDLANTLRGFALLKTTLGETEAAIALWQEAGALYNQVWQEPGSPFTQADLQPGIAESQRQIALLSGL
jgi:tetratricopeptide (TPR) repeat protein